MAVKPDNIMTFMSKDYGTVQLVRRSVALRHHSGPYRNHFSGKIEVAEFDYWRGQLACRLEGQRPETGEKWGPFYRGQVVWLRADIFQSTNP